MAADIRRDTEEGEKAICGGELPAVKILPAGEKDGRSDWLRRAEYRRAYEGLFHGDRRAKIGIAPENDKLVLSEKHGRSEGQKEESEKNRAKSEHNNSSKKRDRERLAVGCQLEMKRCFGGNAAAGRKGNIARLRGLGAVC